MVAHEATGQFAKAGFSAQSTRSCIGLFALFVRLVVGDVKRWTTFVVMTSEKSIARFAGMYNIRFDLGADRKLDRMKRLRRYKKKHRTRRCLNFGAVSALLSDGAISLPLFSISNDEN